jgi:chloride channel 7
MSLFYGPGAIGSGVAETIGVVNGVNYKDFIGLNTLITKALGVIFAVSAGIRVGKEGPLAHVGSLVGVAMIYLPFKFTYNFRNDRDKRNIIASGAGVGVAVAFGAPIGGVLFAYEISKANSFWTFQMAWKTFLATATGNFTLALLNAIETGHYDDITNGGLIKFGSLAKNKYNVLSIFVFILLGIIGGLMGALFIEINMFMARLRKKILGKNKIKKVIECIFFAGVGATIVFFIPLLFDCVEKPDLLTIGIIYNCPNT